MSEDKNYKVQPMNSETLAHRRAHAQRNPWGNTAELVGHIDWQEAQIAALRQQNAALVEAAKDALDIVYWMSGSNDFAPDGKAHVGWLNQQNTIAAIKAALAATAPEVKP